MKRLFDIAVLLLLLSCDLAIANGGQEHLAQAEEGPHGGIVTEAEAGHHLELVTTGPATMLYLLDKDEETVPIRKGSGRLKIVVPGEEKRELKLAPEGEGLGAETNLSGLVEFRALASVEADGKTLSGRFFQGPRRHDPGEKHGGKPTSSVAKRAESASTSITGQIIDSTCLARGELPSADHQECAVRCLRGGAPAAIVERDTGQVYVAIGARGLSTTDLLIPYVGLKSEFFGKIVRQGGTQFFVVERVVPEHDHSSRQGGMVAMSGDMHLEVVALKSGEVRVYVSDEFRKPVPVARMKGSAEVRIGSSQSRSEALVPDRAGQFLKATFPRFDSTRIEVTVRLPLPDNPSFSITFNIEPVETALPRPAVVAATPAASAPPAAAPEARKPAPVPAQVSSSKGGTGEIRIDVKGKYEVGAGELQKGKPARLRFVRHDSGECAREVIFPTLGLKKELAPMGETVIDITPTRSGTLPFTCGMVMMKGELEVGK